MEIYIVRHGYFVVAYSAVVQSDFHTQFDYITPPDGYQQKNLVAVAQFNINKASMFVGFIMVEVNCRRKKIATRIYDYAETEFKIPLVPSEQQTAVAQLFWRNRNAKNGNC